MDDEEKLNVSPEDDLNEKLLNDQDSNKSEDNADNDTNTGVYDVDNENDGESFSDRLKNNAKSTAKNIAFDVAKANAKSGTNLAIQDIIKQNIASKFSFLSAGAIKVLIVLIIIILFIGIILALVFMPALLKQGIVSTVSSWWTGITNAATGKKADALATDTAIKELASYAREKGFNLYNDGFITEKLAESEISADSTYSPSEGIGLDKDGKVKDINFRGSILEKYCLMNAYTYYVEKENLWADFLTFVSNRYGKDENVGDRANGANEFDGMIQLEYAARRLGSGEIDISKKDYDTSKQDAKVTVDPDKKQMTIKAGWFNNPYIFDMNGWSGRYGMPTEFLLALHKSTMAPDLIRELINGTKIEDNKYKKTKLKIRLIEANGNVESAFKIPADTSINGNIYDSNGNKVENIDFDGVKRGDVIYYAGVGGEKNRTLFPLKTTSGPVEFKLPEKYDEFGIPDSTSEYDITQIYLNLEEEKIIELKNFYVNTEYAYKVLNSWFFNNTGEHEGMAFVLNFGLHDLVKRFAKENENLDGKTALEAFGETVEKALKAISDQHYKSMLPLIYKVEDHWFRDVYFYMDDETKYTQIDEDYFIKKGETWTKYKSDNTGPEYQTNSGKWSAYKIQQLSSDEIKNQFKTYKVDEKDSNIDDSVKKLQKLDDLIQIKENLDIKVSQIADARRGETNQRTLELFKEKWFMYDGTEKTADKINESRKNKKDNGKKNIDASKDLLAGGIMLEQMKSLDSEYAYRDYKELLVELNYFKKEDLSNRVRKVMQWPVSTSAGNIWPLGEKNKDVIKYGVKILSKKTIDEMTEKAINDVGELDVQEDMKKEIGNKIIENYGKGVEEESVLSPVTGKIVKQTEDSIEIKVLDAKDNVPQYKRFFDDEYSGTIAGYTVIIKNIKVGITDESKYKNQISDSEIKRIDDEKARKKVEDAEKEKKDAPSRVGEYIKEGTVIGKSKNEDITLMMKDMDDVIIENIDEYIIVPRSGFRREIQEDYMVKIIENGPNQLNPDTDAEIFKKMFKDYPVLVENAEAFLEMQAKYQVNAIFAGAVSICESSGGINFSAIPRDYNNIFSITGQLGQSGEWHYAVGPSAPGSTNTQNWRKYKTVKESIMDFGKLIAEADYYFKANKFLVSEIAIPYCDEQWGITVNNLMTEKLNSYDANSTFTVNTNNVNKNTTKESSGVINVTPIAENATTIRSPFDILKLKHGINGNTNTASRNQGTFPDIPKTNNEVVNKVIAEALSHKGDMYVWGKKGPNQFDCSGFTWYVLNKVGVDNNGYATAEGQYYRWKNLNREVNINNIEPGDILFDSNLSHVALYLGNNLYIHASNPRTGVIISKLGAVGYKKMTLAVRPNY